MKVKICGITRQEDALLASRLGADYIGFIFYPKSPRYISPGNAALIIRDVPRNVSKVGVFVNETVDSIVKISNETGIDIAQLHSVIHESDYRDIYNKGIPYIRVTRISAGSNIIPADEDCFAHLIDTFDEKQYGGTGKTFDWSAIEGPGDNKKIFLSGGLNPENICKGIHIANPYAVDVSSSIEKEPGIKDMDKMKQFIDAAKGKL